MNIHIMHREGMSIRKIAATLGISRNAVRRALRSLTPPTGKRRRSQGDKLAPFYDLIATWLQDPIKSHWTGARILDELQDRGYEGGRTVLMQYLNRVRPKPVIQAEARFHVAAGQQVQIDWGEMGPVSVNGVMTKVYAFVAVLAWSRTLFLRFTTDMELLTWLDCHRRAFEFFGGVPREVLIDNLKTGVDSRAGQTIHWNHKYQELSVAYGFTPRAHFPRRPKTKGRVERMVRFTRERFFAGRDILSINQLNEDALAWLERRANGRVHRVTSERPCDRLTVERAKLAPITEYDVMLEDSRVADAYALVSINGVRYSVPSTFARQAVAIQCRPDGITITAEGSVIARHCWAKPGIRLVQDPAHLPPKPQPQHDRFCELGNGVAELFGQIGRQYVDEVERHAPHAPLAVLREVFERESEFGRPIVGAAIESLLQFNVIKRGALSKLCYRFGAVPQLKLAADKVLPEVLVERRDLSVYDEVAA
jgi:transposase